MASVSAEMLGDAAASRATSAAIARHPAVQAVARAIGEKRYRDAAEILKAYPLGIMGQVGVEGFPSALPGLVASLVNPALGAAVFAGSDAANAYGGALLSSLETQGIDTTDPLAIQKALSDPNIRDAAEKYASKWAIGSAAVGLATGGVGGKVVGGVTRVATKGLDRDAANVAGIGIDAVAKEGNAAVPPSLGEIPTAAPAKPRKAKLNFYQRTFYTALPHLEDHEVHHAIEQQVTKLYPGVMTEEEIHALENLRGIPRNGNGAKLHRSIFRKELNAFYKLHPTITKEQLLEKRREMDRVYGHLMVIPPGVGK
jgi:hypothetical protein